MANNENLLKGEATQFQSGENAARNGRAGGIASGVAKRERKMLADSLRAVLDDKLENGTTRQDAIVAKVVKRLFDEGDIRDLKVLAEVLGEMEQKVNITGDGRTIIVETKEQAEKLANIGNIGA